MLEEAVEIELEYANQLVTDYPVMGLSKPILENTVKNYANERLRAIGLTPIYDKKHDTFLQKLVRRNINLINVDRGTFDTTEVNYQKGSVLETDETAYKF